MNGGREKLNSEMRGTFPLCNFEIKLRPRYLAEFQISHGVPCPLQEGGDSNEERGGENLISIENYRKTLGVP